METKYLERIGLTNSEAKVYLALLELGSTSKGDIVKEAAIASSKIYEVLDKLIDKGLASVVLKNGIKYFKASSPQKIKDLLEQKRKEILDEEKMLETILPTLENKHLLLNKENDAEIFRGWKGLDTVFQDILCTLKKGDTDYVFGASAGQDPKRARWFYDKYQLLMFKKGIRIKAIFNEEAREYFKKSKAIKNHLDTRFLQQSTPTEINIYGDKVLIIVLSKVPMAIMLRGKEIASSFRQYFDVMWLAAKK